MRRARKVAGCCARNFCFLDRQEAPGEEEQSAAYQAIADALGGAALTIRTLDIGGDKPVPYIRFPDEQNPALGARGIRTRLFAPDLVDDQYGPLREFGARHQSDDPDGRVGRRVARSSHPTG